MNRYEKDWRYSLDNAIEVRTASVSYDASIDAWICDVHACNGHKWSILARYPEYFETIKKGNIYRDIDALYESLEERNPGGLLSFSDDKKDKSPDTPTLSVIALRRNIWGDITLEGEKWLDPDLKDLSDQVEWIFSSLRAMKTALHNPQARVEYSKKLNCIALVSEGLNSAIQGNESIWEYLEREVTQHVEE